MRKASLLIVGAALVVAAPSIASAKPWRPAYRPLSPAPVADNAGPHFVAEGLRQIFVPFEVTFAPRPVAPRQARMWHKRPAG